MRITTRIIALGAFFGTVWDQTNDVLQTGVVSYYNSDLVMWVLLNRKMKIRNMKKAIVVGMAYTVSIECRRIEISF